MRKTFFVAIVLLIVAFALYFFLKAERLATPASGASADNPSANSNDNSLAGNLTGAASTSAAGSDAQSSGASSSASGQNISARAGQAIVAASQAVNLPPVTLAANVRRAIRQYGAMFGGDPVGTNPEITSQLLGDNPKHLNFVDPAAGMRVNANGELVDAWGTPYFFHQISGSDMEIHSAGPDKIMWTADDVVAK